MPDTGQHWPRLERTVIAWLTPRVAPAEVWAERPDDLVAIAKAKGAVRLERAGGTGTDIDHALQLEVTVYAGTRGELWDLADLVESALADLAGDGSSDAYVDDVEATFLFAAEPHPDPSVREATATFTITVRPQ